MPSNYSVRPNKHVDRELFAELVGRAISDTPIEDCAYVSMGGPQMADHISMYRKNGITKLYSFDLKNETVLRQKFNAPTSETYCVKHAASELPGKLNEIADRLNANRLIVWLDYTGNKARGAQLAEFQSLLQSLGPGDIARIALDASLPPAKKTAELPQNIQDDRVAANRELLRREMGDYHPEGSELETLNDMPRYLASCMEHVCDRAAEHAPINGLKFLPMLQTNYVDSAPMFTSTVLVQSEDDERPPPAGFRYLAEGWQSIESLEVPELTAREKSLLDRMLDKDEAEFNDQLGYCIAREAQSKRQWASFKKFHRFLPQFQHVEIK
jgi:hypothetical protein